MPVAGRPHLGQLLFAAVFQPAELETVGVLLQVGLLADKKDAILVDRQVAGQPKGCKQLRICSFHTDPPRKLLSGI